MSSAANVEGSGNEKSRWLVLANDTTASARLAAIAEPGFVLIAGSVLASILLSSLGLGSSEHYLYGRAVPDFRFAATVSFVGLALRYGFVFGLAFALGLWRRRPAYSWGMASGRRGFLSLIVVGILVGLLASLPIQILRLINAYLPLGPGTRFWALQARVPWNADFWLYMAVGSFVVVPVFEEVFARGYLLGRVRESFSAGSSLLLMAALFALAHGQYHHADVLAVSDEISLFLWSLCPGYAVYRTGSLIPGIVAHGIINTPVNCAGDWALLAASLLALGIWRKPVASWIGEIVRILREIDDRLPMLLGVIGYFLLMMTVSLFSWIAYVWLALLGILSVMGLFRRSAWRVA
jgi:membrane protease YdiL (CAAX protease family)